MLGDAIAVDARGRSVRLADGAEVRFDYLIIATGATHSYFGHDEWSEAAPGLKTVEDALEIRRRVLVAYEAAEREPDPVRQREWMTFVIVGAGPTGVELAGALAEISRRVLARDFRRIETARSRVVLIEAGPRILPAMAPASSEHAHRELERLGVEVITASAVSAIDDRGITHATGRIDARTAIWAAGVAASPLARTLGVALDRAGRVPVNPDLSVPGVERIFVIGDLASVKDQHGRMVPGVAPAAMQAGRHAARSIIRMVRGEPALPFHYRDKGTLATIGRAAAVVEIGRLRFSGFAAWMLWLTVHIFYLIGFRNRFLVISQWAWVYLRNERGARLITGDVERLLKRGG
jgi:NADH:quinone reductase (non-electrogenic)